MGTQMLELLRMMLTDCTSLVSDSSLPESVVALVAFAVQDEVTFIGPLIHSTEIRHHCKFERAGFLQMGSPDLGTESCVLIGKDIDSLEMQNSYCLPTASSRQGYCS